MFEICAFGVLVFALKSRNPAVSVKPATIMVIAVIIFLFIDVECKLNCFRCQNLFKFACE